MAERKLSLAESKFRALLGIIDALLEHIPDDTPLRNILPGMWPTLGNLRELLDEVKHLKA